MESPGLKEVENSLEALPAFWKEINLIRLIICLGLNYEVRNFLISLNLQLRLTVVDQLRTTYPVEAPS